MSRGFRDMGLFFFRMVQAGGPAYASLWDPRDGWSTQARFWLEWGRSDLPILSSRPEQMTARAVVCGVEGLKPKPGLKWATRP